MASSARHPPRVEADVDGSPRLCRATDQLSHNWLQKIFSFVNKSAVFNVLYNTMSCVRWKSMKKITFLLVFLFTFIVTGCAAKSKPEHVWRLDIAELPELSGANLSACGGSDTEAYASASLDGEVYLISFGQSDPEVVKPDLGLPEGSRCTVGDLAVGENGVWLAVNGNIPDQTGNMQPFNRLYLWSDGKASLVDDKGRLNKLAAARNGALVILSPDGSTDEISSDDYSLEGVLNADYAVAYTNDQEGTRMLLPIDLENKSFGEPISGIGDTRFVKSDHLLALGQDGIDLLTPGEDGLAAETLVDFLASDIDYSSVHSVATFGEKFIAVTSDGIGIMSEVPESEVTAKEIITVAATDTGKIRSDIIAFNKSSDKYRVKLIDYSGDLNRLNLSLVTKDAPDVLLITGDMDYDSMVAKGMFADLYTLMSDRDAYLPNVLSAYETDGKLFSMINRFNIDTFAAKKSAADKLIDLRTAAEYAESRGASVFPAGYSRGEFIKAYLNFNSADSFESETFRYMLEFAKSLPEESEDSGFRDDTPYREGSVLLSSELVIGFGSYDIMCDMTFGEEGIYSGFLGGGSIIETDGVGYEFAVLKSSKHKSGAWEFIESFLGESAQMPEQNDNGSWIVDFGFPVRRIAVEKQKEIAVDGSLTETGAKAVEELIGSANIVARTDDKLVSIVYEEAAAYFTGQKTLDEVVRIISDRADTMIAERG